MSTPLYDELEEKWNEPFADRRICDEFWTVTNLATGAVWYEDDDDTEVFPHEPTYAYIVPNEVKVGDTLITIKVGEPQATEDARVASMEAGYKALASDPEYIRESTARKEGRKRVSSSCSDVTKAPTERSD